MTSKEMVERLKSLMDLEVEEKHELQSQIDAIPLSEKLASILIEHRDKITIGDYMNFPDKYICWSNITESLFITNDPEQHWLIIGHIKIDFADDNTKEVKEIRILEEPYLQEKLELQTELGKRKKALEILLKKFELLEGGR